MARSYRVHKQISLAHTRPVVASGPPSFLHHLRLCPSPAPRVYHCCYAECPQSLTSLFPHSSRPTQAAARRAQPALPAMSGLPGKPPTNPAPAPSAPAAAAPPAAPARLLPGAIEKRRAGKYTHPFGGMRQFAEDRAAKSGWDRTCTSFSSADQRKAERSKLADHISELYKEEFVRVNKAQGKGRPKANNISAAKKTVRMIAERILLSLEARATQIMFKEVMEIRQKNEKELNRLRHIHACGRENPKLTYDEIRALARAQLSTMDDSASNGSKIADAPLPSANSPDVADFESDEQSVEIEMMKQSIVEMRAEEVSRGFTPKLLNQQWVDLVTAACKKLVQESYSRQFVPRTKVYGCKHFTRKNRIQMVCCGTFPVCRMCHIQDLNRIHDVRIEPVETMLCMMCGEVQPKTQNCRKCNVCFGSYYCDICGITDDTPGYDLRHCPKCNVCMPGLTFHCDRCKSCVPATPDHEAVCHGSGDAGGASAVAVAGADGAGSQHPAMPHVNNITGPGESIDQSMEALASVEARGNQLFSGL